jgi:hypothetical protein
MTDGTARVIELMGTYGQKKHIFPRLIRYASFCFSFYLTRTVPNSRDPFFAFTSGQWMTEVRKETVNLRVRIHTNETR